MNIYDNANAVFNSIVCFENIIEEYDDVLTYQWEKDDRGIILCFSRDDTFSYAIKNSASDSYSANYKERKIKDGLPDDVIDIIIELSIEAIFNRKPPII